MRLSPPDGKYLAYSDNTGIYLKLIRTGEVHPVLLPPSFSAREDDWFPDGLRLLISPGTSQGRPACGASRYSEARPVPWQRRLEDWLGRDIWIMRSDGTDQVKIAADKSWSMGKATWSPDGKRIAYVSKTEFNSPTISIEVNDWQNARAETIFSDGHLAPVLHWSPDGRLIYVLANEENWHQDSSLWMVSLQPSGKISGASKRITHGNGSITQINGTADGKHLPS